MAKEARDEILGQIKGKMPMYKNGLDYSGDILLCESGIIIASKEHSIKAPFTHVVMLEKSSDMPLGKVQIELEVFDMLGQKHYIQTGISDIHFLALKKACKKQ